MESRPWLLSMVFTFIATALRSRGAPLIAEGLDPDIFGSVHGVSTKRLVSSGEDLRAYLTDVTVTTLLVNDSVILSSDFWTSTVVIKQRAVQIISAGEAQPAIDLGGLVDAIHVESTGVLGLRNIVTRNAGPRGIQRLDTGARYRAQYFGAWPSITLDPGARVITQNCSLYTYSERAWQQCALFQNSSASLLKRTGYQGNYSSIGQSRFCVYDTWAFHSSITDLATNQKVGAAEINNTALQVICQPDPFLGVFAASPAGTASVAQTVSKDNTMPWWGGLLCGLGALLAMVFLACVALFLYEQRARRRSTAGKDTEKGPVTVSAAACGASQAVQADDSGFNSPQGPYPGPEGGDRRTPCPDSLNEATSSWDEGPDTAGTPGFSSRTNSLADAVMSLPDILRSRSAQLVGSLELGAPLGRGSYGTVYKGKWKGTTVAVKILEHSAESSSGIKELRESVLSSSIIHPNVVSTYKIRTIPAACPASRKPLPEEPQELDAYQSDLKHEKPVRGRNSCGPEMLETWLLLEFCDRGNLDRAIMQKGTLSLPNRKPNLEFVYRCLIDVAAGMDYLHSLGVINGDLKPANILLKSTHADPRGFICKLADFGLSRVLDTGRTHVSTQTHGTLAYQPAELLQEGWLTKAADVHSFSMIMYEMYTHKRLFDGCNMGQAFFKILMGYRPALPPDMPPGYRSVMTSCWSADPNDRPDFEVIISSLQGLLQEHMHELHGMQHMATIDLPFSDERALRPAEQAAENAAFMARIQAAARQAYGDGVQPQAEHSVSCSTSYIGVLPEGHEASTHVPEDNTFSDAGGWLGNEEMGQEASPTVCSWDVYRAQSGTSSFDEQLWAELDAHARRRRSSEGVHVPVPRPMPGCGASFQGTALPFAQQVAAQGAPTLFGQPLPCQPSGPGWAGPPKMPSSMGSPFAAAAQLRASTPASPSMTAAAPAGQAICPSSVAANAKAEALGSMALPFAAVAQHTATEAAAPAVPSRPPAGPERQRPATAEPMQEAMGLDELGRLNKRPKRRPILQHKMAEMLAALNAKSQSSAHTSSSGSASNGRNKTPEQRGVLLDAKPVMVGQFPKALSEECPAACPSISNLLDVKSVSQSVPELPPPSPMPGTGMSRNEAQIANEQVVSQVLRKKIGPGIKAGSSKISSLLQSASSAACAQTHIIKPASSQEFPTTHDVPTPQPPQSEGLPARRDEHTMTSAEPTGGSQHGHASLPRMLPSELLQQGVRSMGSALQVQPSAFGGFTVREDYIAKTMAAMRLAMDQARSMPAEGASRTELERLSRSSGPSVGNKCPASARMHPCKQGAVQPASGLSTLEGVKFRGHSMPSQQPSKPNSTRETARCSMSLGPLPVDRTDVMPPASDCSTYIAAVNGVHSPCGESQGSHKNPFASFTV